MMFSKEERLKSSMYKIFSSSTSHGLSNLLKAENLSVKILWSLSFISAWTVFFYLMSIFIIEYLKYETISDIQFDLYEGLRFPVVLICNYNIATLKNVTEIDKINLQQKYENISKKNISYSKKSNEADIVSYDAINKIELRYNNLSQYFNEMVIKCNFARVECNANDFTYSLDNYGFCLSFDKKRYKRNSYSTQEYMGLELILYLGKFLSI